MTTATMIQNAAAEVAAKLNKDADLVSRMTNLLESQEDVKVGPLAIMHYMRTHHTAELELFPVPGTKAAEGSNAIADKYTETVTSNGKSRVVNGSFYRDFAKRFQTGAMAQTILDELKHVKDGKKSTVAPELNGLGSYELMQVGNRFAGQLNNTANNIRRAMALHFQLETFKSKFGKVCRIGYSMDGDEVSTTTTPIYIQKIADPAKAKVFSVGGFLQLDADLAESKGGTWEEIVTSAKREPEAGNTGLKIEKVAEFESAIAGILNYVETGTQSDQVLKAARASGAFAVSLKDLYLWLDDNKKELDSIIAKAKDVA